jgi:hypothetical protein
MGGDEVDRAKFTAQLFALTIFLFVGWILVMFGLALIGVFLMISGETITIDPIVLWAVLFLLLGGGVSGILAYGLKHFWNIPDHLIEKHLPEWARK